MNYFSNGHSHNICPWEIIWYISIGIAAFIWDIPKGIMTVTSDYSTTCTIHACCMYRVLRNNRDIPLMLNRDLGPFFKSLTDLWVLLTHTQHQYIYIHAARLSSIPFMQMLAMRVFQLVNVLVHALNGCFYVCFFYACMYVSKCAMILYAYIVSFLLFL